MARGQGEPGTQSGVQTPVSDFQTKALPRPHVPPPVHKEPLDAAEIQKATIFLVCHHQMSPQLIPIPPEGVQTGIHRRSEASATEGFVCRTRSAPSPRSSSASRGCSPASGKEGSREGGGQSQHARGLRGAALAQLAPACLLCEGESREEPVSRVPCPGRSSLPC